MPFNYSKLKGRIVEIFGSQTEFAKAMGLSERTMSIKLNGKVPWKQTEICTAIHLLKLSECHIQEYFFDTKVKNT